MEKVFLDFIHNVIASPLLEVAKLLRLCIIVTVVISFLIVALFTWKNPLDIKTPEWIDWFNPVIPAKWFHEITYH